MLDSRGPGGSTDRFQSRHYLQSPYYFMCVSLYDATEDRPAPVQPSTALAGTLVSSLHRLKDVDNTGQSS